MIRSPRHLPPGTNVPSMEGRTIELVDLATHTAGLPTYPGPVQRDFSTQQLLQWLNGAHLQSKPGVKWFYSNAGFSLLGLAMADAQHATWATLVERQIFSPLGMVDTKPELNASEQSRKITGYDRDGSPLPDTPPFHPAMNPSGGLYSTLEDMMKWLHFNLGQTDTPLNSVLPVTHQPRHQVDAAGEQIGLGWQMSPPSSKVHRIFKAGDNPNGFHAFMIFDEQHKTGVVILTNYVNTPAKLATRIMDML